MVKSTKITAYNDKILFKKNPKKSKTRHLDAKGGAG